MTTDAAKLLDQQSSKFLDTNDEQEETQQHRRRHLSMQHTRLSDRLEDLREEERSLTNLKSKIAAVQREYGQQQQL